MVVRPGAVAAGAEGFTVPEEYDVDVVKGRYVFSDSRGSCCEINVIAFFLILA